MVHFIHQEAAAAIYQHRRLLACATGCFLSGMKGKASPLCDFHGVSPLLLLAKFRVQIIATRKGNCFTMTAFQECSTAAFDTKK